MSAAVISTGHLLKMAQIQKRLHGNQPGWLAEPVDIIGAPSAAR